VYEQCLQLSDALAGNYSEPTFNGFKNNCYKPLNQIVTKINSKYTIMVSASRNPGSGPAPITVTFDARASKDPSNETIPSRNYFRYYRDTKGVDRPMGVGSVINYTFEESGNYTVHLTVRSSNVSKGILDGEMNLNVDVAPKAANIIIYANTKKLEKTKLTKI
jgi:PKD repeat protein